MTLDLGRLQPVELRSAWIHEANDYTPWLASNLDRLSDIIGITLKLEGTEVSVGPFSADILALDVLTNTRVLIENQLEQADHVHLGQILTYIAGLEANTVVWTAKAFRDEHRSAIQWLNLHTTDDFSFFAVEVSAVRIGDSPIAPLFRVVEQPNNWDRQIQRTAPTDRTDKPPQLAREFWDSTIQAHPELSGVGKAGPGGSNVWIEIPGTDLIISLAFGVGAVGWFIRGRVGIPASEVAERLVPHRECLEEALTLQMQRSENGWSGFSVWVNCNMRNRDLWKEKSDWFLDQTQKVLRACETCLGRVAS